ncbi:hypothetical protein [Clostridium tertium]|uniref:hypothetical protein n=1 Tax=Clostridium tertium TaxID=1559 RepID=UPI0035620BB8
MESLFLDVFKLSPVLGIMAIMWFYQRKDYTRLVEDTRLDSKERENELRKVINKNQEIISELVDDVKKDVSEIKEKLERAR